VPGEGTADGGQLPDSLRDPRRGGVRLEAGRRDDVEAVVIQLAVSDQEIAGLRDGGTRQPSRLQVRAEPG